MPDPARVAQAQALEVPVVISGATTVPGTDKRELFTENVMTTLIFDDGAVLHLRSKVAVGQAIFIHNQQNGKEVLCKVLEAPGDDSVGHTHLEFSAPAPGFWDDGGAQAAAPAPPASQAATEAPASGTSSDASSNGQGDAHSEDTLAMMSGSAGRIDVPSMTSPAKESGMAREELVPAHEMVSVNDSVPVPEEHIPGEAPREPGEPTGEQIDEALKQLSGGPAGSATGEGGAEPDAAQTEAHLAAMMAREARYAKFAAAKEKKAADLTRAASPDGAANAELGADGASPPSIEIAPAPLMWQLTNGKYALYTRIVAGVLLALGVGLIGRQMKGLFFPRSSQPSSAAALAAKAKEAGPAPAAAPTSGPTSAKTPAAAPKVSAATPTVTASTTAPTIKIDDAPAAAPRAEAAPDRAVTDPGEEDGQPKHGKRNDANPAGFVPAQIVSQPQPTFPKWAKGLDLDGVVKLDAEIDENGNVSSTTILLGPRPLQHAAEEAVGLWIFEPARADGKPVSSHLVLTVEFKQ
jgi:TonB family protein